MQRWRSGRTRTIRNRVMQECIQGFKSLSLRQCLIFARLCANSSKKVLYLVGFLWEKSRIRGFFCLILGTIWVRYGYDHLKNDQSCRKSRRIAAAIFETFHPLFCHRVKRLWDLNVRGEYRFLGWF